MKTRGRGFTMVDLVVAIGVAGVLSAVGVPAVRSATNDNALQRCRYNLRGLAQGNAMYTEDFGGRMWALSWRQGMKDPVYSFNYNYGSDMEAQGHQAIYALRRVLGMNANQLPLPSGWVPTLIYSHVALLDYMGARLPSKSFICPLDTPRVPWIVGNYSGLPTTGGDGGNAGQYRWLATMSYSYSVYQWMPDRQVTYTNAFGQVKKSPTAFPSSSNILFWNLDPSFGTESGWWGPKLASDVRYPSQKVAMFDEFARHNGAQRYHAYQTAAQDLLFYDGSARFYRTDATNPGWNPSSSSDRSSMTRRFTFTRQADWLGGLDNNRTSDTFAAGWYRWTRGGLLGWDVPRLSSMVGRPPSNTVVENEIDTRSGQW
jgi:hypothetical protein